MIKHRHHIIECHNGKRVRTNKTIFVTVSKHAQMHKEYWKEWGFLEDKVAWLSLSEQMVNPELFIETSRIGGKNNKGKSKSKEHKEKISKALKDRAFKHGPPSKETKKKISEALKGNNHFMRNWSEERRKQHSERMKKSHKDNPRGFTGKRNTVILKDNKGRFISNKKRDVA